MENNGWEGIIGRKLSIIAATLISSHPAERVVQSESSWLSTQGGRFNMAIYPNDFQREFQTSPLSMGRSFQGSEWPLFISHKAV